MMVGDVRLGHHAQHMPALQHHGGIVQAAARPHRQPGQRDKVQPFAGGQHGAQALLGPAQQRLLQKQIPAGIAGQAQLGQTEQLYAVRGGPAHGGNDLFGVVGAVRHPQSRAGNRTADKTIAHRVFLRKTGARAQPRRGVFSFLSYHSAGSRRKAEPVSTGQKVNYS